jgi:predicted transglutaminase-like cysteine proteinase
MSFAGQMYTRPHPQHPNRLSLLLAASVFSCSVFALELGKDLLDFIQVRFGDAALNRIIEWQNLSNSPVPMSHLQKLEQVNQFFNKTTFISDQEHWGREDYWASPVELLATNGGDCEDYSIAKYFTLRELGISEDQLKITYVKALELNLAHMVLAYYETPGAEPLILDNLINEVRPASQRQDLMPVYSFNGEGLWLAKMRNRESRRIGDADKLNSWQELLRRHDIIIGKKHSTEAQEPSKKPDETDATPAESKTDTQTKSEDQAQ